jgi:hypothetical protein
MIKRTWKAAALLAIVSGMVFGAVTLAQAGSSNSKSESTAESTAPENSAQDPDNVQYTAPGDSDYGRASAAVHRKRVKVQKKRSRGATKARGAQDAQDPAQEPGETNGEQESQGDSETGQPGEPPAGQGHADSSPNAQHECTGNCVE